MINEGPKEAKRLECQPNLKLEMIVCVLLAQKPTHHSTNGDNLIKS